MKIDFGAGTRYARVPGGADAIPGAPADRVPSLPSPKNACLGMRLIALPLLGLLLAGTLRAQDLVSARCTPALTEGYSMWRAAEAPGGLAVEFANTTGGKASAIVTGAEADEIRVRVASLELTQSDVETLQSQSLTRTEGAGGETVVILRPFDGAMYQFSIRGPGGLRNIAIDNPSFDLAYHPQAKETERLKKALELLELLERRAKGRAGPEAKPPGKGG